MIKKILLALTIFAFFLRFYQVGINPSILNRDEAALAYNAYLLKEVGQDEWGRSWPVALESFGDFKLPGYPLILAALFNVLPLQDWIVRFPSVIAGTLLIPLGYLFARRFNFSTTSSLFFAFLLTTSPINLFYSRIAFEANVALTLFVGALTLLFSQKKTLITDILALVLILISIFTYNTPLLLLPFIIPALIFSRGIKNWQKWTPVVLGLGALFVLAMSLLWSLTSQKSGITIFSDESSWRAWIAYRESLSPTIQSTFGSRYVYWLGVMAINFWESFTLKFLIIEGGTHPWHSLPNHGHLYLSTYILGLIGILSALVQILRNRSKDTLLLLYLLVISLAPSVITVDSPHTTRSLFFVFILTLFAIKGLIALQSFIQSIFKKNGLIVTWLFVLIILIEASWYLHSYFSTFPQKQQSWQPGFNNVIQEIEQKYPHDQVAVVDGGGFHYILTAWYLKIPAQAYLSNNVRQLPDKIGFRYGERVRQYHFIVNAADRKDEKALIMWDGNQWKIE